jgi:hypothetical protein
LRSAEFGFFGVVVYTRVQTPRFWGDASKAGTLDFQAGSLRPVRINCVVVAMGTFESRLDADQNEAKPMRGAYVPGDKGRRL